MQQKREMTGALFIVQRDMHEVRVLLDTVQPILNQWLEFAFENLCHALSS
jgi:hypothetical protein